MIIKEYPHVPAAFINAIAEEGTKEDAVQFLQEQWNETCYLRKRLEKLDKLEAAGVDNWEYYDEAMAFHD
jgi:hypothetical protein